MRATSEQDVGNYDLAPHKAMVLERNKGIFSWYNSRGWENYSWVYLG
jgi:hypothetical protein